MSNVHCGQNSVNSGSAITAISIKTLKPTQQPKCIPQHHDNIPSASTLQNQYFKIIWIPFNFFSCQNLNLQFINLNSIFSTSKYFKILLPTVQRKWHQHIINVSIDAQDFFPLAMQNTWQNQTKTGMPPAPDLWWNSLAKDKTANMFNKNS